MVGQRTKTVARNEFRGLVAQIHQDVSRMWMMRISGQAPRTVRESGWVERIEGKIHLAGHVLQDLQSFGWVTEQEVERFQASLVEAENAFRDTLQRL